MVFRDLSCCDSESGCFVFISVNRVANESKTLAVRERGPDLSQGLDHGACDIHGFVRSVEFAVQPSHGGLCVVAFCLRLWEGAVLPHKFHG